MAYSYKENKKSREWDEEKSSQVTKQARPITT